MNLLAFGLLNMGFISCGDSAQVKVTSTPGNPSDSARIFEQIIVAGCDCVTRGNDSDNLLLLFETCASEKVKELSDSLEHIGIKAKSPEANAAAVSEAYHKMKRSCFDNYLRIQKQLGRANPGLQWEGIFVSEREYKPGEFEIAVKSIENGVTKTFRDSKSISKKVAIGGSVVVEYEVKGDVAANTSINYVLSISSASLGKK